MFGLATWGGSADWAHCVHGFPPSQGRDMVQSIGGDTSVDGKQAPPNLIIPHLVN